MTADTQPVACDVNVEAQPLVRPAAPRLVGEGLDGLSDVPADVPAVYRLVPPERCV